MRLTALSVLGLGLANTGCHETPPLHHAPLECEQMGLYGNDQASYRMIDVHHEMEFRRWSPENLKIQVVTEPGVDLDVMVGHVNQIVDMYNERLTNTSDAPTLDISYIVEDGECEKVLSIPFVEVPHETLIICFANSDLNQDLASTNAYATSGSQSCEENNVRGAITVNKKVIPSLDNDSTDGKLVWTLAHEIGHVLGLKHPDPQLPENPDNLMNNRQIENPPISATEEALQELEPMLSCLYKTGDDLWQCHDDLDLQFREPLSEI